MLPLLSALAISIIVLSCAAETSASFVRRFTAAPKRSHLRGRGLDFTPHLERHILVYQDEFLESAARVSFIPKYPTLVLDDIHDHIKIVTCSPSSMVVHFYAEDIMAMAVESWKTDSDLVMLSTHTSCASSGAHGIHTVRYLSSDVSSQTIVFQAIKRTIKEVSHHVFIDLGNHVVSDVETNIVARQEPTSSTSATVTLSATTSVNDQTASLTPTETFEFSSPPATATAASGTRNIAFSQTDKFILPPDETIIQLFPGAAPLANMQMGCKNCSMTGSLTLKAAGFDVQSNALDQAIDFFDNGFFQFTADGVSAHMEFELDFLPGFEAELFVANVTKIPLTGIAIGDIITIGPMLEITIPIGIVLNSPINFTMGFELTIPDNSQVILNVSNISESSQTGFDLTTFNALPLNANTDDLSFNLTAALKPKLTISAGVGDTNLGVGINGGVGAFIDVPKLIATVESVEHADKDCNPVSDHEGLNRAIKITRSAVFDLGLHWDLEAEIAETGISRGGEQVLASRTFGLSSSCLVFDAKTSSLVPANDSTTDSGSTDGSNSAAPYSNAVSSYVLLLLLMTIAFINL